METPKIDNSDTNNSAINNSAINNSAINNSFQVLKKGEYTDEYLLKLADNFMVYYYNNELATIENNRIVNRIFNLYMKTIFDRKLYVEINDLFEFINSLDLTTDIYNLKSGDNLSNLFKYLSSNNVIIPLNNTLNINIVDLLDYIYVNNINMKLNIYFNIIDICYNNIYYLNDNMEEYLQLIGINYSTMNSLVDRKRIRDLNLESIESMLNYLLLGIYNDKLWINDNYLVKLEYILLANKFVLKNVITKYYKVLNKFILLRTINNKILTNSYIQKNKIVLRNKLISYKKQVKSLVSDFLNNYKGVIDDFIVNNNDINILVDGRNIFYSKNKNTNNIDINKIITYDNNIAKYNKYLHNKLKELSVINNIEYIDRQYNHYIIFSANHYQVLKNLQLHNTKILYSPYGLNDDIIQLYLWLSYSCMILISSDKHNDYIKRVLDNNYLIGLITEIKRLYQYNFK
jgi:hypothetical protein